MVVINQELVKSLYRKLLGREAESAEVIAGHIAAHDTVDSLIDVFINGPEFKEKHKPSVAPYPYAISELSILPEIKPLAKHRQSILEYPFAIFNFELTNKCPFKCIMCARTNNMTRKQGLMDLRLFKKAVDEFIDVNPRYARQGEVWLHHFGESLVHPDFDKFIAYARSVDMNCGLSINPLLLTDKIARKLLDSHPTHLYCSLDGHDNTSFEKIRGIKDAYEISKIRMLDFLQLKIKGGYNTKISLSMINFPLNTMSVDATKTFWEAQKGLDAFLHKDFVNWDGNAKDVNVLHPSASRVDYTKEVTCDFPWKTVTITWDGDVVPCCFDYNKRYVLGNINQQTLTEIWNGPRMQALRKEFINNKVTNPLCKNCVSLRT